MAENLRELLGDRYGDNVKSWKFDWRDKIITKWIDKFVPIAGAYAQGNLDRQHAYKTGKLKRSLEWKTWAASGGDAQVFEARYNYYAKFVDLAVGRGEKYDAPVPEIPNPKWRPITVPSRRRKGKPISPTELRRQASKFTSLVRKELSFAGTIFMIYAMGNNQECASAVNRALQWAAYQDKVTR